MEHMGVESRVPIHIAKKGVKLAEGRIVSLIAPSEASVLKMDLLELTRL